jgi:putative sigma-54 modulation protein
VQITISTRHGQLSDATQAKIQGKVERLSRYFERLSSIDVTVDLGNQELASVDVRVSAEHKHDFVATEQAASLMAAVDGAVHKLEQQLRKYKERVQERHRQGASRRQEMGQEGELGPG